MASTSDSGPVVLPSMPDFTPTSLSSTGNMKYHLQALLDSKEKQVQQAGTLGQRVLAQQMELEERIKLLQEMDSDRTDGEELDGEGRERYQQLAETIRGWDEENERLSSAFSDKVSTILRYLGSLWVKDNCALGLGDKIPPTTRYLSTTMRRGVMLFSLHSSRGFVIKRAICHSDSIFQ
jgi:hypothetical protein